MRQAFEANFNEIFLQICFSLQLFDYLMKDLLSMIESKQ